MPPNKSIPDPWLSFLRELDSAVDTEVRLDCMGGFVVTMVYGFSRPTADLDVLEIAPREAVKPMLALGMQGGPLHKKYKIYLDPVGVAHVPENYEDRLAQTSSWSELIRIVKNTKPTMCSQALELEMNDELATDNSAFSSRPPGRHARRARFIGAGPYVAPGIPLPASSR